MKTPFFIPFLFSLGFSLKVSASTLGVFNAEEQKARAVVRGNADDRDAENLYLKMMARPVVEDGFFVKRASIAGGALELLCAMSPRFVGLGTCTLDVRVEEGTGIDFSAKRFWFERSSLACDAMIRELFMDRETTFVFQTTNGKLRIEAVQDPEANEEFSRSRCRVDFRI